MNDFNLSEVDRLLTTTKQVRKRLDLTRDVPTELLLECIEVAGHAPVGGNLERNRWIIVTDPELKAEIAHYYSEVGRPYLAASADIRTDERTERVIESSVHLIDHLHEVPALVIPLRLDRPPTGENNEGSAGGWWGSVLPGVWSFQLAARARGLGSTWTTFHLAHEAKISELLGIPSTVSQCALLPVAFYTGDTFHPAPRRPVEEVTYLNGWKQPIR
ncbi:MAG: nitroreductase family protein [Actinomycetota bacterium]|nr:nitroreductase family protein [Actinomycetota bacterium]